MGRREGGRWVLSAWCQGGAHRAFQKKMRVLSPAVVEGDWGGWHLDATTTNPSCAVSIKGHRVVGGEPNPLSLCRVSVALTLHTGVPFLSREACVCLGLRRWLLVRGSRKGVKEGPPVATRLSVPAGLVWCTSPRCIYWLPTTRRGVQHGMR